jgi:hypothetical protein
LPEVGDGVGVEIAGDGAVGVAVGAVGVSAGMGVGVEVAVGVTVGLMVGVGVAVGADVGVPSVYTNESISSGTLKIGFDPVDAPRPTQAVGPPTDAGIFTLVHVCVKQLDPGQEPPAVTS